MRTETANLKQQIEKIALTSINFEIYHELNLTMINGKVFNSIAESPSQVCAICQATPSTFNNLEKIVTKTAKEHLYEYGLSTLHA